jgi:hypothetical protein
MTTVNIGKGIELDVDFATMPQAAIDHILYIGARNILMDCHAGISVKALPDLTAADVVAQSRAAAEKKLAALLRGEVRTVSTRASAADPVGEEARRIARATVTDRIKAAGKKVKDFEPDAINAAIAKVIAADPTIMERARQRVEENRATASDVDLADLGL